MLDFNNEEEQRERNYGPVPSGSIIFARITLEKPRYAAPEVHDYVSISQKGLLGLWCKFEVAEGTYAGCSWYENLWLPKGFQTTSLTDGQTTACNMSGAKIRAMIEASRGVSAKDTSLQASRKRQIGDWLELSGMKFPTRVGIDNRHFEKDGKSYWNNCVTRIITPDMAEYDEVRKAGEIITNGAVAGSSNGNSRKGASSDEQGYDRPPVDAYESDMPF